MTTKIKLLSFGVGALLALSCSEDLKPTPYTYTKLFTGENNKTWKIKLFEETANGTVVDKFLPSCVVDDRFRFYANTERRYETTSGTRQCFADEPGITSSNWSYNGAKATLTMVIPILSENTLPFIIKKADKDDFEAEIFFDETNTSSYRIHFESTDEE